MKKDVLVAEKAGKEKKKKSAGRVTFWVVGLSCFAVALLIASQFLFTDAMLNTNTFHQNVTINGINVSGMDKEEATNMISAKLLSDRNKVLLTLAFEGKEWSFKGTDFEVVSDMSEVVDEAFNFGRRGNIFEKRSALDKIKNDGINFNISYKNVLAGMEEKIDSVISEIETEPKNASIKFNPDAKEMFKIVPGADGMKVDRGALYAEIDRQFANGEEVFVEIPVTYEAPIEDGLKLLENTKLRSKFKTSYKTSTEARKSNVKKAMSAFNGKVVLPGEEVSFNQTTGTRSEANGYKKANIILNGVFVEGTGGGVCQASTTLYNAVILADLEVTESVHHSLPVSYVPLAFDAMVAEGYADLKFRNNTEFPIYIKTWADGEEVHAELYGMLFEDGVTVKQKTDFIRTIPHGGDKIIQDTKGEYQNKITYKGEYLRIKYPQEGYESKGFVQYIKDGKVTGEKLIRHDTYSPQEGLIIEGTEDLVEGMELPKNDVKFIGPQVKPTTNSQNVKEKLTNTNPEKFNP